MGFHWFEIPRVREKLILTARVYPAKCIIMMLVSELVSLGISNHDESVFLSLPDLLKRMMMIYSSVLGGTRCI